MTDRDIPVDMYDLEFTQEEREGIRDYAKKLATLGENSVNDFVNMRNSVCIIWIQSLASEHNPKQREMIQKTMDHQNLRFDSIVGQARMILQIEGRDSMSVLDEGFKRAGWGSMYDKNSKAYEHMRDVLNL